MSNSHDYRDDATPSRFKPGAIVWVHPATDTFMRGDVTGVVASTGRKWVHVRMTRSGRMMRIAAPLLAPDHDHWAP